MGTELPPVELPRRETRIDFVPSDPKYSMHAVEYDACWQAQGRRIIAAYQKVTSLPFTEDHITAYVGRGDKGRSHSGHSLTDPLLMRYGSTDKIGTLIHELTHRFIMQHNLWRTTKEKYGFKNVHQLLDLIYFDLLKELYGEPAAMQRVEHEKGISDPAYRESWEWAMGMKPEERKSLLDEIMSAAKASQNPIGKI